MATIRVEHGALTRVVDLGSGSCWRIGRLPGMEVPVDDPRISKDHAVLKIEGGQYRLRRTRGKHPILVNGVAMDEAVLQHGMSFAIGETRFTFELSQEELAAQSRALAASAQAGPGAKGGTTRIVDAPSVLGVRPEAPCAPQRTCTGGTSAAGAGDSRAALDLLEEVSQILAQARDQETLAQSVLRLACDHLRATRGLLARSVKPV